MNYNNFGFKEFKHPVMPMHIGIPHAIQAVLVNALQIAMSHAENKPLCNVCVFTLTHDHFRERPHYQYFQKKHLSR